MTRIRTLIPKFDWIGPFIGIAAIATLIAAPALADDDTPDTPDTPGATTDPVAPAPQSVILIDQVQLNNVIANLDVEIEDFAKQASVTSTAVANTASGFVDAGDMDLDIRQSQDGTVSAIGILDGGSTRQAGVTTTAYGNSSTGGSWSGNTNYISSQITEGKIEAGTIVDLDETRKLTAATTGIANVSIPASENGNLNASILQESKDSVETTMDVDIDLVTHAATIANTAGGNSVSNSGSTTTNISSIDQRTDPGNLIEASTDIYIREGRNILGTTTAFGNSTTVHNEWGYASLGQSGDSLRQMNGSDIDSQTYVTLDHWTGSATSNAYGVGNAATISNVGSDTALYASQTNFGTVYTSANFTGTSPDGNAIASATSIGNAATATLCATCGDAALTGQTLQYNGANILANTTATVGFAGNIHGAATAVGNAATYQSNGD
ncbi:MAG: holdfast anchor protein HfaD [Pseudomonadota bacterium]